MKVALIHYRYGTGGGMDAHLVDLARGFSARGDSVDVWAYESTPGVSLPSGVQVRLVEQKVRLKVFKKIAFFTQVVRDLKKSDYDLVVGTMRTSKQDINVNGGTHIGFTKHVNKRFRENDLFPMFFEWRTFHQAKMIVAHSKMVADEIHGYYHVPMQKIRVIHPPADESRFNLELRKRRAELQKKYDIDPSKFTVIFPSTNHKVKGLDPLLEGFSKLPADRFDLLIAGVPMEGQVIPKNVRFLGYIKQIEELYASCDLMVLPSNYDGFGLVVIESLACGTPVVISKMTGAIDLIDESNGIVLGEVSAPEIEKAILTASQRKFQIDPNFLSANQLTVGQHVKRILEKYAEV